MNMGFATVTAPQPHLILLYYGVRLQTADQVNVLQSADYTTNKKKCEKSGSYTRKH